jgi:hypothetical protein
MLVSNEYIVFNLAYTKIDNFNIDALYKLFNELINELRTVEILYIAILIS